MIVIMGVSGCGKTTIGKALAKQLGLPFFDADDFHPQSNIDKMKQGTPLTDHDRMPWLSLLADHIKTWDEHGGAVLACSALKESYRNILASQSKNMTWIYLKGSFELIQSRLEQRELHYMKSGLLQSQFDALEEPDYGIHITIENHPEQILSTLISKLNRMRKSEFGVIGLGVMGKSLSLNIAEKGIRVSVYNRSEGDEAQVVPEFLENNRSFKTLSGFSNLQEFVESLEQPRKILMMVKAGSVIDSVIAQVVPFLSKEDILIDGGNSHFTDTQNRFQSLKKQQIHFIGCGISGGEAGARTGPSLMPGGTVESYNSVAPILEAIAAKDTNGQPCCAYIGNDGSGHFVKMIHNGMEYAEMQLLAEVYALMSQTMDHEAIAKVFSSWNKGDLSSYVLDITIDILRKKEEDHYLLDKILDKAEQKGTGSWSSKTALDLGVPTTMMTSAVFARYISAFKATREQLSKHIQVKKNTITPLDVNTLEKAYRFARIVNHHQGFEVMNEASKTYHWNLNLSEIARIWTNGCIIRSQLMQDCISFLNKNKDLLSHKAVFENLQHSEFATAEILQLAISNRVPLDTFWAAYTYWISMTTKRLPANVIQAQRDYFGAHTYQRLDRPLTEYFHTKWNAS